MLNKLRDNPDAFFITGSSLISASFVYLSLVIVARSVDVHVFGDFSFLLAVAATFATLSSFGLQGTWLKVFAAEKEKGKRWIKSSIFVVGAGSTFFIFLLLWGDFSANATNWIAFHIYAVISVEIVSAVYLVQEKYSSLAKWQLFQSFFRVLVIYIMFNTYNCNSTECIAIPYALTGIISLISCILILKDFVQIDGFESADNPSVIKYLLISTPYGISSLLYLVYFQCATLTVPILSNSGEAGLYNSALSLIIVIYLLPNILFQKYFLPKLHKWGNINKDLVWSFYKKSSLAMFLLGFVVFAFIYFIATWFIEIVYGDNYLDSIVILKILSLGVVARFLSISSGTILNLKENIWLKNKSLMLALFFNATLIYILAPKYGAVGAAYSFVFCEVLLCALYFQNMKKAFY